MDRSATLEIPSEVFHFSGQSTLETWSLTEHLAAHGWHGYEEWRGHELSLCLQRIRELVDAFPTYQRKASTGRPPTEERDVLLAVLVRQFFDATFSQLVDLLRLLQVFLRLTSIPGKSTLTEKNRSPRLSRLLDRFHVYVLRQLPARKVVGATDSTGYSNKPRPWSETDFGLRAHEDWLKDHSVIDTEHLVYLNLPTLTPGKVHDSRVFAKAWAAIPEEANVTLVRSLADAAYSGTPCLEAATAHGATPLHAIRKDARHTATPETLYEKLVNFATHWPHRFAGLTKPRGLVETVFFLTKQRFGYQLRCRDPEGRRNEIRAKRVSHNIRIILLRQVLTAA